MSGFFHWPQPLTLLHAGLSIMGGSQSPSMSLSQSAGFVASGSGTSSGWTRGNWKLMLNEDYRTLRDEVNAENNPAGPCPFNHPVDGLQSAALTSTLRLDRNPTPLEGTRCNRNGSYFLKLVGVVPLPSYLWVIEIFQVVVISKLFMRNGNKKCCQVFTSIGTGTLSRLQRSKYFFIQTLSDVEIWSANYLYDLHDIRF